MAKINLSAPWIQYYREVEALFAKDDEVHVIFDEDEVELKIYVDDTPKAVALDKLLPDKMEYGGVVLKIVVIPANTKEAEEYNIDEDMPLCQYLGAAFYGNGALRDIRIVSGIFANDLVYVIFKKEVVQYYNDNLGDYNGICSTLYQNIAKNVLKPIVNVYFCTDTVDNEFDFTFMKHYSNSGKYFFDNSMWP